MSNDLDTKVNPAEVSVIQTEIVRPITAMPIDRNEIHRSPAVYTTMTLDTPAKRLAMYDMMIVGSASPESIINAPITITDVVIFPVSFTDKETGEIINVPSTVLVTAEHGPIQFFSNGIWSSLTWMRFVGLQPFGRLSSQMILRQIQVGEGKRMFQLHRVQPEQAKKPK